jgi:hypothetical protein
MCVVRPGCELPPEQPGDGLGASDVGAGNAGCSCPGGIIEGAIGAATGCAAGATGGADGVIAAACGRAEVAPAPAAADADIGGVGVAVVGAMPVPGGAAPAALSEPQPTATHAITKPALEIQRWATPLGAATTPRVCGLKTGSVRMTRLLKMARPLSGHLLPMRKGSQKQDARQIGCSSRTGLIPSGSWARAPGTPAPGMRACRSWRADLRRSGMARRRRCPPALDRRAAWRGALYARG